MGVAETLFGDREVTGHIAGIAEERAWDRGERSDGIEASGNGGGVRQSYSLRMG